MPKRTLIFTREVEIIAGNWFCGTGKNKCPYAAHKVNGWWCMEFGCWLDNDTRPRRCKACIDHEYELHDEHYEGEMI